MNDINNRLLQKLPSQVFNRLIANGMLEVGDAISVNEIVSGAISVRDRDTLLVSWGKEEMRALQTKSGTQKIRKNLKRITRMVVYSSSGFIEAWPDEAWPDFLGFFPQLQWLAIPSTILFGQDIISNLNQFAQLSTVFLPDILNPPGQKDWAQLSNNITIHFLDESIFQRLEEGFSPLSAKDVEDARIMLEEFTYAESNIKLSSFLTGVGATVVDWEQAKKKQDTIKYDFFLRPSDGLEAIFPIEKVDPSLDQLTQLSLKDGRFRSGLADHLFICSAENQQSKNLARLLSSPQTCVLALEIMNNCKNGAWPKTHRTLTALATILLMTHFSALCRGSQQNKDFESIRQLVDNILAEDLCLPFDYDHLVLPWITHDAKNQLDLVKSATNLNLFGLKFEIAGYEMPGILKLTASLLSQNISFVEINRRGQVYLWRQHASERKKIHLDEETGQTFIHILESRFRSAITQAVLMNTKTLEIITTD